MKIINCFKILSCLYLLFCLCACTTTQLAPVEDGYRVPPTTKKGAYKVKAGDTLYSIAWAFGDDYREIAQRNKISAPYKIQVGQLIYIKHKARHHSKSTTKQMTPTPVVQSNTFTQPVPAKSLKTKTVEKKVIEKPTTVVTPNEAAKPTLANSKANNHSNIHWLWPADGKVVRGYSPNGGLKGIDIAGSSGAPVRATANGKVVYSGRGLRGYGELIIIKHNEEFLSAYAHNSALLVKEGDSVRAGQEIAKMGNTDAHQVMLHFEIRRAGKPVNPMDYLARK